MTKEKKDPKLKHLENKMYVLDSDVAIEYLKGNKEIVEKIDKINDCYITTINAAELFYGYYFSNGKRKNYDGLINFLQRFDKLTLDLGSSKRFGKIKAELRKNGNLVADSDIFIAAITLNYEFTLITRNMKDFSRILNLQIMTI